MIFKEGFCWSLKLSICAAVTNREEAWKRHVEDSLALLPVLDQCFESPHDRSAKLIDVSPLNMLPQDSTWDLAVHCQQFVTKFVTRRSHASHLCEVSFSLHHIHERVHRLLSAQNDSFAGITTFYIAFQSNWASCRFLPKNLSWNRIL